MRRPDGQRTATQDHDDGSIPVGIKWLSPFGTPFLALGLQPKTIGRGRTSTLTLDDAFLSERHAEISQADGVFLVRDLVSKNGTFLNGVRVEKAVLRAGDVLRLGEAVGVVSARAPVEPVLSRDGAADCEQRLAAFRKSWRISASEAATLARVVLGEPNKLVADALDCSIATVEAHVTTLLRRARVGNRTALVAKFWSTGVPSTS